MAEQRHYQGIRKGSPFVIQSLRKKTNKGTNEQIQRKNKREKERSGDYDTLLHSGVSLQPKGMPGKGGYKASHWGNGDEAPRRPPSGVPNR